MNFSSSYMFLIALFKAHGGVIYLQASSFDAIL